MCLSSTFFVVISIHKMLQGTIFKHTMFWFVKCLKSQTWLKYIVQPSCLLYPESRYVYICVPVSGAFVSRYLYPSRRCREAPPGSGTIIISSPDSCIYPPIILPTCPCLTTTKVSQKSISFRETILQKRWFRNMLSLLEENQVGIMWQKNWGLRKMSSRTELSVWTECWAVQGASWNQISAILPHPWSIMSCTSLTKKIPPF